MVIRAISTQFWKFCGLVGFVCTALAGQSDYIREPYKHWVSIGGIVGTAIHAFYMKSPSQLGD